MRAANEVHEQHPCLRRSFTKKVGPGWPRRSWESDDTRHDCGAEVGTHRHRLHEAVDRLKEDAHISFAELAMVVNRTR